jgi:hypothetical protein
VGAEVGSPGIGGGGIEVTVGKCRHETPVPDPDFAGDLQAAI